MNTVWDLERASAEQIREALPGEPHDSTVRTLLRILESKGYLAHDIEGQAYVYRATVNRDKAQLAVLRSVLARFFAGSAQELVVRLIEDEKLTHDQLDQIQRTKAPRTDRKRRSKTS
jgi:BlaI family transcriptional regulator, penicillinase repressor